MLCELITAAWLIRLVRLLARVGCRFFAGVLAKVKFLGESFFFSLANVEEAPH